MLTKEQQEFSELWERDKELEKRINQLINAKEGIEQMLDKLRREQAHNNKLLLPLLEDAISQEDEE